MKDSTLTMVGATLLVLGIVLALAAFAMADDTCSRVLISVGAPVPPTLH